MTNDGVGPEDEGASPSYWSTLNPGGETPTDPTDGAPDGPAPLQVPPPGMSAAPTAKPKRGMGKALGLAVAAVGLVGGGAFAVTQITGGEKANTPEQAIESFYRSLESGDAIGMAKALAPGERDIMLDSMVPMMKELSRLDILDRNLDLNKVSGVESKLSDFTATSKIIRSDLAEVRVTGGSFRSSVDPKKLPLGAFVRDILGDQIDAAKVQTNNSALKVGEGSDPLIMQKVGDRWYISLNYSIAEASRRTSATAYAVPVKGGGIAARGADSAEAAVSEMITAAARFDARRMIELLPPDEFAALHDYSAQFIAEAENAVAEARRVAKIDVSPKLRTTPITDDRALVSIVDLPATLKVSNEGMVVEGTYANKVVSGQMTTPDGEVIKADYRNSCITLVVGDETKKGCGQKGIAELFSELSGQEINTDSLSTGGVDYGQSCVRKQKRPSFGMIAVKADGKWFVSPTRTMLDSMTMLLKTLDRADLDCIKTQIEKSFSTLQGSFLPSATDSTFDAPADPANDPFAATDDTFTFETAPDTTG